MLSNILINIKLLIAIRIINIKLNNRRDRSEPSDLRPDQDPANRRVLVGMASCTHAVIAVSNDEWAASGQIPLDQNDRR